MVALLLAGSTAFLAVPRSVDPVDLPEPRIDFRALEGTARADEALARAADQERLDVDVLALGTALFDYGEADAAGDDAALARERGRVLEAAARAHQVGARPVLALRAHHLRTFLAEVHRWEVTGEETPQLRQVGGGFPRLLRRNGWVEGVLPDGEPRPGARPRVLLDRAVLAASFKKHWSEVTGLRGEAYDLTLDEARVFYRFLLAHPATMGTTGAPRESPFAPAARSLAAQYRLKKLDELAAADPSYPVELAKGVVLYQGQRYPQAVEAFRRHLDASPDGPLTLRAQNYLHAALVRARDE